MARFFVTLAVIFLLPATRAPAGVPGWVKTPRVSVRFDLAGTIYIAEAPAAPGSDVWLQGPLVFEYRAMVAPRKPGGQAHPFLRVLFDIRAYKDENARVDVTVENTLHQPGAATVTYDVKISANGRLLFQHDRVTHYYLTRWRKVFGPETQTGDVHPDLTPFLAARAVPRYLDLVRNRVDAIGAAPSPPRWARGPRFDILQGGALNYYMPDHGGRPELAPYPDWTARYLAHPTPKQLAFVRTHGDLSGSWPIHVRQSSDYQLVSIDKHPRYWFDQRFGRERCEGPAGTPLPDVVYAHFGPTDPDHQSPLVPDNAHVPSLAYVPYLITGDRYYADEMRFWGNYALLFVNPKEREGSKGLLAHQDVRGFGWTLRNLVDAAAYLPDDDPFKKSFAEKVNNNLHWLNRLVENQTGPLGVAWISTQQYEFDPKQAHVWIKLWMYNYLAWAIDHALDQGFDGGRSWRDQIARFQLSLFTSPDWDRTYAAPYGIAIGGRQRQEIVYFTNLKEAYQNTQPGRAQPEGQPGTLHGYYGVDARLMLQIALKNRWPGAEEANVWLERQLLAKLAAHTGWALAAPAEVSGIGGGRPETPKQTREPVFHLTRGWVTFGLALPAGVSFDKVQVGNLPTQTDVKARWGDGSIRFAIITTRVPSSGSYRILAGKG